VKGERQRKDGRAYYLGRCSRRTNKNFECLGGATDPLEEEKKTVGGGDKGEEEREGQSGTDSDRYASKCGLEIHQRPYIKGIDKGIPEAVKARVPCIRPASGEEERVRKRSGVYTLQFKRTNKGKT